MKLEELLDQAYAILGDDPDNPRFYTREDLIALANQGSLLFRSQTREVWHRSDISTTVAPPPPIPVDPPDPEPEPPVIPDPALFLQTMIFNFYTYNSANPLDWSVATMTSRPYRRGFNWTVWRAFFLGRGLEVQLNGTGSDWNGTAHVYEYAQGGFEWVLFRGVGNFHFASAVNWAITGFNPPAEHFREMKRLSKVGTKCISGFQNFESINQRPAHLGTPDAVRGEPMRAVSRGFPLTAAPAAEGAGTGKGAYGCTAIDKGSNENIITSTLTCSTNIGTDTFATGPPHGLVAGDRVSFSAISLTTGISPNTTYHVRTAGLTANAFTLSTTGASGSIINLGGSNGTATLPAHRQGLTASNYLPGAVACPHSPNHNSLPSNASGTALRHYWDCDVRDATYISTITQAAQVILSAYYGTDYDGELWDNANDAYKGFALNDFPTNYSTDYTGTRHATPASRKGWKGFFQSRREATPGRPAHFIWANTGYQELSKWTAEDLTHRWNEFFFSGFAGPVTTPATQAVLVSRITAAAAAGLTLGANIQVGQGGTIEAWARTAGPGGATGTWAGMIPLLITANVLQNFVVTIARTDNYIFWQPGMTELVV